MDRTELHKKSKPRLYIVDGNGYIYRAFFALPKMNTSKGVPSNAIYGFTNMIRKLLVEEKPDYIAVAFDAKEKTFRHDSYENYKVDRPEMPGDLQLQIPYIRQVCHALNIPVLEKPGYEADDLIATLMEHVKSENLVGVMVTSDKDLMQLVSDKDEVYALDPMKDYFVYDNRAVEEKWGVGPEKIVELLSIMGDSIDNIPGVKGIGPKGALELVQKFGSVENILAHLDQIEKKAHRQKIEEFRNDLILSRQLVQLRKDVPEDIRIQDLKAGKPRIEDARSLFLELEFYSILSEFLTSAADRKTDYALIENQADLSAWIKRITDAGKMSIHCQLDSESGRWGSIIGIALSCEPKSGAYIPLGHDLPLAGGDQLDRDAVLQALRPLLENESIVKIAHDLKQQIVALRSYGIRLRGGSQDPMLISYVLNPTRHAHSLADIAKEYLQYQVRELKDLVGSGQKKKPVSEVGVRALADYCCEKTDLSIELSPLLENDLKKEKLDSLYFSMELPVLQVLSEVEWNGVKIDVATLQRLSQEMGKNLDRLVSEIYETAGGEFNINSPKQIGEVLYNRLKLPMVKKTKTGDFSTSVEVLEELAQQYEFPQKILEYRQFTKLKSTYVDALPLMIDRKTKRVHTNYQQTVAATGRLSSVDPNLQNIPIRTPWGRLIRDAFVAEEGNCLISADYSQIELRVMAHLSQDPTLIDSFLRQEDIHARTASEVFNVPLEKMTKEIRNQAKAINYGINYGQSPFGLAQLLGIDQKDAKKFIDQYFQKYPKVKEYLDRTTEFAREHGYVTTLFGRRRYVPEIRSRDRNVWMAAQRAAINTPLQGTAADIIKLAMVDVQKALEAQHSGARLTMQVHDELVLEVPEQEKESVAKMVKDKMENVAKLVVPLTVDLSVGRNWREAK
jgi:DNA polymerase I